MSHYSRWFLFAIIISASPLLAEGTGQRASLGPFAYVSYSGSNALAVIDTVNDVHVATIPLPGIPSDFVVSPDGRHIYVARRTPTTLLWVIDAASHALVTTIGMQPYKIRSLVFHPDGSHLYVSTGTDQAVIAIDTESFTVDRVINVGKPCDMMDILGDGSQLYVLDPDDKRINIIDTATGSVVGSNWVYTVNGHFAINPVLNEWYSIFYAYDDRLWFRRIPSNSVATYDLDDIFLTQIWVTPNGKWFYLERGEPKRIAVFDAASRVLVSHLPFDVSDVAFSRDSTKAYMTSQDVVVIDVEDHSVAKTIHLPNPVKMVDVGPLLTPEIQFADADWPYVDLQTNFGLVHTGDNRQVAMTIHNDGNWDLVIGQIGNSNGLAPPFSIVNDNCSITSLAPDQYCQFEVRYQPINAGHFTDSFNIPSNDSDEPQLQISLQGGGDLEAVADIEIIDPVDPRDDLFLPFGTIELGQSVTQTLVVRNRGDAALTVQNFGLTGDMADFQIDPGNGLNDTCGTPPFHIPPPLLLVMGCKIDFTFTPTSAGSKTIVFEFHSNDPDTPQADVTFNGTGVEPAPVIELEDTSGSPDDRLIAFGDFILGQNPSLHFITIKNQGTATLNPNIQLGGQDPGAFGLIVSNGNPACGSASPAIPPGGLCQVAVAFVPITIGNKQAQVDISSNDPVNPNLAVMMTGTALPRLPWPSGGRQFSYPPAPVPIQHNDPALCQPVAVGAVGHGVLALQIALPYSDSPVHIYFGVQSAALGNEILVLTPGLEFRPLSQGMFAWKTNFTGILDEALFGTIDTSTLQPGIYYLYLLVSRPGSVDDHFLWITHFVVN